MRKLVTHGFVRPVAELTALHHLARQHLIHLTGHREDLWQFEHDMSPIEARDVNIVVTFLTKGK